MSNIPLLNVNNIIFLFYCISLLSCDSKKQEEEILSMQEMKSIYLDIYLAENQFSNLGMNQDTTINLFERYEQILLERKNITKQKLRRSEIFYANNPKLKQKIFDQLLDTLTSIESIIKEKHLEKLKSLSKDKGTKPINTLEK